MVLEREPEKAAEDAFLVRLCATEQGNPWEGAAAKNPAGDADQAGA